MLPLVFILFIADYVGHDDVIKWKRFPRYWPFARGIHRSAVNSPHKGQWRGALMFSLICAWINDWVNNHEAGDLRRLSAHYDVIVMNNRTCGRLGQRKKRIFWLQCAIICIRDNFIAINSVFLSIAQANISVVHCIKMQQSSILAFAHSFFPTSLHVYACMIHTFDICHKHMFV